MSDDGRPAITTAQPPIVLHTSDHVDFRVFQRILALPSPFFQGMFALPQPSKSSACANSGRGLNGNAHKPADEMANSPSVEVPEGSQTLDTLLRFLYPNTHVHQFDDLIHARSVAIAASKYVMSAALDKIAAKVQAQYAASHPLEVYFIAWRMGWVHIVKAAAEYCLDPALVMEPHHDALVRRGGILDYPDAGIAYHRLQAYRHACRRALEKRLGTKDMAPENNLSCEGDHDGKNRQVNGGISDRCLKYWMTQYRAKIKQAVLEHPRKETLDQRDLVPNLKCEICDVHQAASIATLHLKVASKLKNVLSVTELEVALTPDF